MEFTPDEWETIKALFDAALERPQAERSSFLRTACHGAHIQAEVERLLANHTESTGFLSASPLPNTLHTTLAPPIQCFQTDDVLADRFRIRGFRARGAMGEVYEAEDLELHDYVAVKTIRTELVRDGLFLERFKREVHLAKKVTHPNVCRIFDLFRHRFAEADDDSSASVVFVTMELLNGETLEENLRCEGRMNTEHALPLALQMAAGLGAAHAVGVLHRDFKPGNVVLVPAAHGSRAVITDFGLAVRASGTETWGGVVTDVGQLLGTPAYMSPEQVENRELTPASDVYSLGLVLYQMVTGTRPFDDSTPLTMAVRRLRENPISPRVLVPDLDRRWEAVILRCLERDPEHRLQNADEVGKALGGEHEVSIRRQPLPWLIAVAAALFGLALTSFVTPSIRHRVYTWWSDKSNKSDSRNFRSRISVAILPFRNLSGRTEADWVSTALSEMLTTELAVGEKLRILPGENIARANADLALPGRGALATDTLGRLRQYLGNDFVVLGSYLDLGRGPDSEIRVDLLLQDAKSGNILASISERGTEQQLDDVATRAGSDLRESLGTGEVTASQASLIKATLPSSPEAVRLYSEGLKRLHLLDALAARDLLQRAVSVDPKSALIHSALADSWQALGYEQRAKDEANNAYRLSSALPREQRLWIEAKKWASDNDWSKATTTYHSLSDFFPDNIEYGLSLSHSLIRAGNAREALTQLTRLRHLLGPSAKDPRIDLEEAAADDMLGDFQKEELAAQRAAGKAKAMGARLLLARALDAKTRSLGNRGAWKPSGAAALEARQIYSEAGDRAGVAGTLRSLGVASYKQGNNAGALSYYRQALGVQREIGYDREAAVTLNDLATLTWDLGDWLGSEQAYKQSLELFQTVDDKLGSAAVLQNLGGILLVRGDLVGANSMFSQGLQLSREIGDKSGEGTALVNLADILANRGNLSQAKATSIRSLALFREIGDQSSAAYALMGLGDVLLAQGDLNTAREKYTEALKLREQSGEQAAAARTSLAIAELSLEQGRSPGESEGATREVLEIFRKENDIEGQIDAHILLSRVLLKQHRIDEAQLEIGRARESAKTNQDLARLLRIEITGAQVDAASGKLDLAFRVLKQAITRAKKSGFLDIQLHAQLALGEIQMVNGDGSASLATLTELKNEAQKNGFGLLLAKANKVAAQ